MIDSKRILKLHNKVGTSPVWVTKSPLLNFSMFHQSTQYQV